MVASLTTLTVTSQVQKIVHGTFVERVMNSTSGVFINMFNRQSALYKAHTPELKKLAVVLEAVGSPVRVLQYDWNQNELPEEAKELDMVPT